VERSAVWCLTGQESKAYTDSSLWNSPVTKILDTPYCAGVSTYRAIAIFVSSNRN
jgi:hypothetical protein